MNLKIGDMATFSKTLTESDVYQFAGICGDFNPLHIDREKAKEGRFGKRVCHGMLVASLISAVIGTKLPGNGAIYLNQELKFVKPVYIDDTVEAEVTVSELHENGVVILATIVRNQKKEEVIVGKAAVLFKD